MTDSNTSPDAAPLAPRRHFLAVLGVAACSSPAPIMAPCPPEDGAVGDVMGADATGSDTPAGTDTPVGTDTPAADVSMACATSGVRIAAVGDLAVGAYRLIQQRPSILIILGRDARGYFAYSARCTHTGCTVPAPADAMSMSNCPCHFSRFDSQGRVQSGSMARTNLDHYAINICEGGVYVDRAMVVPIDTRTAVP